MSSQFDVVVPYGVPTPRCNHTEGMPTPLCNHTEGMPTPLCNHTEGAVILKYPAVFVGLPVKYFVSSQSFLHFLLWNILYPSDG